MCDSFVFRAFTSTLYLNIILKLVDVDSKKFQPLGLLFTKKTCFNLITPETVLKQ